MKLLKDLLYKIGIEEVIGSTNIAVADVAFDSRKVRKESLFVAIRGSVSDGHDYLDQAVAQGARALIVEKMPEKVYTGVTVVITKDSSSALGWIASNWYGNPSNELKLVGITGTNGKTTTATLLYELMETMDLKAGLLSTVKIMIHKTTHPATHTTPDPLQINANLRKMVDEGCKYAFMEVSSHGLDQKRVEGLKFEGGVFTNITHDHLDYHKTFDQYIVAKKKLFDALPKDAFALVNDDDRHGQTMLHHTKAKVNTYALKKDADFKVRILEKQFNGMLLKINQQEVWTKLIGEFNAYNITAVYAVAKLLGFEDLRILTALSTLGSVDGRFQYLRSKGGRIAIIDYAHTPDALLNVLNTIQQLRSGNETVITVVGCGGDRDKAKRPEMARIATEMSDRVILTSDNPRTEDPNIILREMEAGVEPQNFKKSLTISDRREAIKAAVQGAAPNDIILIAGKGHEKYQDINGVKHPFDDVQEVTEFFKLIES